MEKLWNLPSILFSIFATIGTTFLGGNDNLLHAVIFMIAVDYIVGVIGAIIQKQLSSKIGFNGFLKKLLMIISIAVAVELNKLLPSVAIRELVLYFYIANEGISILENLCKFVPVPEKMKDFFLQIRG